MGFCRRCGDIIRSGDTRCHCGGASRDSVTKALLESPSQLGSDKWSRAYLKSSPSRSNSPLPLEALVEKEGDGGQELKSVFGSVLTPLDRWECVNCQRAFRHDEHLYPHPDIMTNPNLSEVYFCRPCFAERYSKGNCKKCKHAVLTDAPFIVHSETYWHSSCYHCTYCDSTEEPVIDFAGLPACEDCFARSAYKDQSIPTSPHLAQQYSPRLETDAPKLRLKPAAARWGAGARRSSVSPGPRSPASGAEESAKGDSKSLNSQVNEDGRSRRGSRVAREREKQPMLKSWDELKGKFQQAGLEEKVVDIALTQTGGSQTLARARSPTKSPLTRSRPTSPLKPSEPARRPRTAAPSSLSPAKEAPAMRKSESLPKWPPSPSSPTKSVLAPTSPSKPLRNIVNSWEKSTESPPAPKLAASASTPVDTFRQPSEVMPRVELKDRPIIASGTAQAQSTSPHLPFSSVEPISQPVEISPAVALSTESRSTPQRRPLSTIEMKADSPSPFPTRAQLRPVSAAPKTSTVPSAASPPPWVKSISSSSIGPTPEKVTPSWIKSRSASVDLRSTPPATGLASTTNTPPWVKPTHRAATSHSGIMLPAGLVIGPTASRTTSKILSQFESKSANPAIPPEQSNPAPVRPTYARSDSSKSWKPSSKWAERRQAFEEPLAPRASKKRSATQISASTKENEAIAKDDTKLEATSGKVVVGLRPTYEGSKTTTIVDGHSKSANLPPQDRNGTRSTIAFPSSPAQADEETCAICRQPLGYGDFAQVGDGPIVHRECFRCKGCGDALDAGKHVQADSDIYHAECAPAPKLVRTTALSNAESPRSASPIAMEGKVEVCTVCALEIDEGLAITLAKSKNVYHEKCLSCTECGKGFGGENGRSCVEEGRNIFHAWCAPVRPLSPLKNHARTLRVSTSRSTPPALSPLPVPPPRSNSATLPVQPPLISPSIFATRTRPPAGLGGLLVCAGCSVRATEKETVKGPLGKRYHAKCLVCGICSRAVDSESRTGEGGGLRCESCRKQEMRRTRTQSVPIWA